MLKENFLSSVLSISLSDPTQKYLETTTLWAAKKDTASLLMPFWIVALKLRAEAWC
jgi:hypothetical protein